MTDYRGAACDRLPQLFDSHKNGARAMAFALCEACPIRIACLEEALTESIAAQHGIRGGHTSQERRVAIRLGKTKAAAVRRGARPIAVQIPPQAPTARGAAIPAPRRALVSKGRP